AHRGRPARAVASSGAPRLAASGAHTYDRTWADPGISAIYRFSRENAVCASVHAGFVGARSGREGPALTPRTGREPLRYPREVCVVDVDQTRQLRLRGVRAGLVHQLVHEALAAPAAMHQQIF